MPRQPTLAKFGYRKIIKTQKFATRRKFSKCEDRDFSDKLEGGGQGESLQPMRTAGLLIPLRVLQVGS